MTLNPYNSIYGEYVSNKIHHKAKEQNADDDHHKDGQHNKNNGKINAHSSDSLTSVEENRANKEIKKIIG